MENYIEEFKHGLGAAHLPLRHYRLDSHAIERFNIDSILYTRVLTGLINSAVTS